jgi:hypothetical protein
VGTTGFLSFVIPLPGFVMENRLAVRVYPSTEMAAALRHERRAKKVCVRQQFLLQHTLQNGLDALDPFPNVEALRAWCKRGAYSICSVCYGLQPHTLNERDLRMCPDVCIDLCNVCKDGHYVRPQWMHIPPVLRGLQQLQVDALSPLALAQGEMHTQRTGYRGFSRFTRVRWKEAVFEERVVALPLELQAQTWKAYTYLRGSAESAYDEYASLQLQHRNELASYDFIASKYIENALWPDLYPFKNWCDSCFLGNSHRSPKASFMAKAYSAVLDYAGDLRMAQLAYDRWMFVLLTSRYNHARRFQLPMSYMLQDKNFTEDYVKGFRALVVDVIRQIGMPQLYQTYAPAEWNFPLHDAILDMMNELGVRDYFDLGGPVALNIIHSMQQLVRGFLFGSTSNKPWAWRSYVFCNAAHPERRDVVTFLIRQELQLGADRPSQGRNAWHWHILSWHKNLRFTDVHQYLRADIPRTSSHVAFWADEVQKSHKPFGPVEPRHSHWDAHGHFVLQYPTDAHARNIRPYLVPMLLVTRGHSDVQLVRNPEEAVEYLSSATKYVTKQAGLIRAPDVDSSWGAVRAITDMFRPSEAELWASLAKQGTCYLHNVGNVRPIFCPTLEHAGEHELFQKYLRCTVRSESVTFLEWLRQYKTSGLMAVRWRRQGLRAVAMQHRSPLDFAYYEQLLLCRTPCRSVDALFNFDVCQRVPSHMQGFCALLLWQRQLPVRRVDLSTDALAHAFFTRECVTKRVKQLCVPWVRAIREHVRLLTSGQMHFATLPLSRAMLPELSPAQRVCLLAVQNAVEKRAEVRANGDIDAPSAGMYAVDGAPGTGKSTVLMHIVNWCEEQKFAVCMLTSTGLLAESYRKHGVQAFTDTFDGGTGYGQLSAAELARGLSVWQIVIVDEVFALRREQLEHLHEAWSRCGRWPVLVFCGDSQQLRPWNEDGTPAELVCHALWWRHVYVTSLWQGQRQRAADFAVTMAIRSKLPTQAWLDSLCSRRLIAEGIPCADDALRIYSLAPQTQFLAVSRAAVSMLNALCSQVIYRTHAPLCQVRTAEDPDTLTPLHYGERIMVTYNIDKQRGLVNGKVGHIVRVCAGALFANFGADGVQVIPQFTLENGTHYTVVRAHALTIAKSQGATLPHVTLYMEEHMRAPAVGYVALTRVRSLDDLLLVGFPTRSFFTPLKPVL